MDIQAGLQSLFLDTKPMVVPNSTCIIVSLRRFIWYTIQYMWSILCVILDRATNTLVDPIPSEDLPNTPKDQKNIQVPSVQLTANNFFFRKPPQFKDTFWQMSNTGRKELVLYLVKGLRHSILLLAFSLININFLH